MTSIIGCTLWETRPAKNPHIKLTQKGPEPSPNQKFISSRPLGKHNLKSLTPLACMKTVQWRYVRRWLLRASLPFSTVRYVLDCHEEIPLRLLRRPNQEFRAPFWVLLRLRPSRLAHRPIRAHDLERGRQTAQQRHEVRRGFGKKTYYIKSLFSPSWQQYYFLRQPERDCLQALHYHLPWIRSSEVRSNNCTASYFKC